ncbi:hypothetical protein CONLIGDRAFT_367984 [Coniochaeta ligniaria NRRL 30616]|uniref:Uncharacterized protein n=1 Tax=Coniochaeta ligniaria NRRL 30616 TaxID=1408157 RepID=A0A1J7I467_9PEZI|nr:hypothetical protein CONLIGDRAFT_367984 [Coniochaeta ligniaria NRRL 30616]
MPTRHKTDDLLAVYERLFPNRDEDDSDLDDGSAWAILVTMLAGTAKVVKGLLKEDVVKTEMRRREKKKMNERGEDMLPDGTEVSREDRRENGRRAWDRGGVRWEEVSRGRGWPAVRSAASREGDAAAITDGEAPDRRAAEVWERRDGKSRARPSRDVNTGEANGKGYGVYRQQGTARGQRPGKRDGRRVAEQSRAAERRGRSSGPADARQRPYNGDGLDRGRGWMDGNTVILGVGPASPT